MKPHDRLLNLLCVFSIVAALVAVAYRQAAKQTSCGCESACEHDCGDDGKAVEVTATRHPSYFERNDSPRAKEDVSYLVFKDRVSFEKVFHLGAKNKPVRPLTDEDFKSKLVIAVVRRGNAPAGYRIESAELEDGSLRVSYKATSGKAGAEKGTYPLILSVLRDGVRQVEFVENGERVHTEGGLK